MVCIWFLKNAGCSLGEWCCSRASCAPYVAWRKSLNFLSPLNIALIGDCIESNQYARPDSLPTFFKSVSLSCSLSLSPKHFHCLSVCLSSCLSIRLSLYLCQISISLYMSLSKFSSLCLYLSVYTPPPLSIHLSIHFALPSLPLFLSSSYQSSYLYISLTLPISIFLSIYNGYIPSLSLSQFSLLVIKLYYLFLKVCYGSHE